MDPDLAQAHYVHKNDASIDLTNLTEQVCQPLGNERLKEMT